MSTSKLLLRLAPLVVALAASALAPRAARADPSGEERALADVRFREGRELLDKQRYDDACAKFEESERLWPRGGTVLNLATCREKQGKPAAAWAAYTRALGLAQKEGRADREELARNKVAELQGQLSWLVIQVPADLDVPGAVVTRDGVPIGRGAWGVPIPVDPGRHVVVANVPGQPPVEAVVDVGPRGDRRSVTIPHNGAAPHVLPTTPTPVAPNGLFPSLHGPADPSAPGVVRLHVDTKDQGVRLFMLPAVGGIAYGAGHPVCSAPCDMIVDGRDGQLLYFDGDGVSRSNPFFISDRRGDLTARVSTGSSVLGGFGSTAAFIGVLGVTTGGVLLLTAAILNSDNTDRSNSKLVPVSAITLGISAPLLAAGIVMMVVSKTSVKLDDGHGPPKSAFVPRLTKDGVGIAF